MKTAIARSTRSYQSSGTRCAPCFYEGRDAEGTVLMVARRYCADHARLAESFLRSLPLSPVVVARGRR